MLTIAIIGRPNVGKSTLFNRLMGARLAVVSPTRGTTRDRLLGTINWNGQPVTLIDMGGADPSAEGELADAVDRQIERGLRQADVIALVADGQDGLLPADEHLLARLRRLGKPILLAVNKLEARPLVPPEFLKLGLDEPTPISALHGHGIGELLDRLIAAGPKHSADESAERAASPVASIAIVGRQNVGKSSLLNHLLQDERAIISDVPGTTRDTIDTLLTVKGKVIRLVDTAGLRHRRKVRNPVDYFAMGRTAEAIQRCDVAVLLIDGSLGIANDDRRIMTKVCDSGCGLVLAVNKWDLAKGGKPTTLPDIVRRAVPQAAFAPVLPISAKTGFQVDRVIPEALRVAAAMRRVMTTEECTALLQAAWRKQPPSRFRGRTVTLKSAEWIAGRPVRIRVTTKPPGALMEPYRRFLLKHLHAQPQFVGVPIHFLTQETGIVLRPSRRGAKRPTASGRRRNA